MKQKVFYMLALLLMAVSGAMAQSGTPSVKKLTVPDTWTGDMTVFSAADLPSDFAAVGDDVVATIPAPTATGNAVLIYGFSGGETKYVEYANGVQSATDSRDFPRDQIYGYVNIMGYEGVYYTAAAGTSTGYSVTLAEGTEDADKWTISPAEGLEGAKVTVTYSGEKKVKSVKAVKKAAAGKTVDLSTYSGDSYEVTEDVTFTGTTNNEISILYKGEGYEVTLDNVNAPKCYISAGKDNDNYTVNVKLKGTSRLAGIYGINASINIGEAAAGGTVILFEESPLGGSGSTITINGGTVKAKTTAFSVVYSSLEVNGGAVYLEAAEDSEAVGGDVSGSVTLYGWNGSAWETYSEHRYLSTDNSKAPSEWTW